MSSTSSNSSDIPLATIARIFKELSFKDPTTTITISTLDLSSEYIKLFINEAILRSNEERIKQNNGGLENVVMDDDHNEMNTSSTQYPTMDELDVEEVDASDDEEDEYILNDESNTQKQLKQVNQESRGRVSGNGGSGNDTLDSNHLAKIAGILLLDF
ncbi:uncharacterized protein J8A68_002634 [[Candida] subhashii]|uniref:Uncharacterized protein n=1 Tax=[Candida] subhashii TaxID=561895 RepID=A0A8J5QKP7_9ASCO|nr:uncharacterized protein J8A68_002634 [[Candida] subhashii]KAG7663774.1 hypothetical protein J8A68_002634 [[Candida] subhashii]